MSADDFESLDAVYVGGENEKRRFAQERGEANGDAKPRRQRAAEFTRAKPQFHEVDPGFLLARLNLGDEIARGAIIENVYAVAELALRKYDPEAREAATLATVVYLLNGGLARYNPAKAKFRTFVSRILESRAKDELRRPARSLKTLAAPIVNGDGDETALLDVIPGDESTPSAQLAFKAERLLEDRERFAAVVAVLDEREVEILQARAEGLDYDEIAERLGIPAASSARRIACEARDKVRAALEALGEAIT